jgi:hypothetical protein
MGEQWRAYFAIMLPGSAMLTVQSLPLVGLNMAVGLEVSSDMDSLEGALRGWLDVPLGIELASERRFRF